MRLCALLAIHADEEAVRGLARDQLVGVVSLRSPRHRRFACLLKHPAAQFGEFCLESLCVLVFVHLLCNVVGSLVIAQGPRVGVLPQLVSLPAQVKRLHVRGLHFKDMFDAAFSVIWLLHGDVAAGHEHVAVFENLVNLGVVRL